MEKERRSFNSAELIFRAETQDNKRYLSGYAALYGVRSTLIAENNQRFYEIIERGAFDEVLKQGNLLVRLTYNHKQDMIIASTASKTLELSSDEKGLFFRAEIPENVSYANDVYALVQRGDLFSNSFYAQALTKDMTWGGRDTEGYRTRTVKRFVNLFDVSIVPDAAYPDTVLMSRALSELETIDKTERQLEINKVAQRQRFIEIRKDIYNKTNKE